MNIPKKFAIFLSLYALATSLWADDDDLPGLDVPGQEQKLNRDLWQYAKGTPYELVQAQLQDLHAQSQKNIPAEAELPNGWRMAPAGTQLETGRYPCALTPFAGGVAVLNNGYYVETKPQITFCSADGTRVLKSLDADSLFPSLRVGSDGDLYISGGYDQTIFRYDPQWNLVKSYAMNGYTAGLAPVDKTHLAAAYLLIDNGQGNYYTQGKLSLLDTKTGRVQSEVECGRMPYAVEHQDHSVFVSLLSDSQVAVYAVAGGKLKKTKVLNVGNTPSAFVADPSAHRLYVMDQNSDEITVLDSLKLRVLATWNLRRQGFKFGAAPTGGQVAGDRLYVTLARLNAVAVLDKADGTIEGYIPTGWYPTALASDGPRLYVLSAKGIEPRRPNLNGPQPTKQREEPGYVLTLLKGSLGTLDLDDIDGRLSDWTDQVTHSSPLFDATQGFQLPIKYVFYIVKENRTYDQVLGDLDRGNGDRDLTIFGQDVTPNFHQMARDFVDLDDFFVDGEISVLGHSYTTSGYASPFLEWLGMNDYAGRLGAKDAKNPRKNEDFWPFGTVPFTFSPSYLWDALDAKGVDYRIYGEDYYVFTKPYRMLCDKFGGNSRQARKCYDEFMKQSGDKKRDHSFYDDMFKGYEGRNNTPQDAMALLDDPGFLSRLSGYYSGDDSLAKAIQKDPAFKEEWADFLRHYCFDFKGWDLTYSDLRRAAVWKKDFERQVRSGDVFPLQYIWLPNDHTAGLDPKSLTPYQFLAQNDAAVGAVVDAVSKSPIWKQSLIVAIEDDSQNGPDHVDAMRSVALMAGPSIKRGQVVSDLYDQLGLLRTLEMILGLDPLNLNDGVAAPMFSVFTDKEDDSPYRLPPPSRYLTDEDRRLYKDLVSQ